MPSKITIVCFDINSCYDEDLDQSLNENITALESPLRILDEYMENHLFLDSEKIKKSSSEIKYVFSFCLSNNYTFSFDIVVLNDLSFIHDISSEADAYLVFINLENKITMEQLEKIIKYIIESCAIESKTYLVGIYQDKILPNLNKEILESYFEEEKLNCEYYQIKCENYGKNEEKINHKCIQQINLNINNKKEKNNIKSDEGKDIKPENKNCKSNKKNFENNKSEYNLIDIVELIFIKIYEDKMSLIYEPDKKMFTRNFSYEYEEGNNNSKSKSGNCCIF